MRTRLIRVAKVAISSGGGIVLRYLLVAVVLFLPGQTLGTVHIWLSETGTVAPGSAFPVTSGAVPRIEPPLGSSQTIYIWGRPDPGKSLVNISLNLVAETQPLCLPTCTIPDAIAFTGVTVFNDTFGNPSVKRFEYTDDSTSTPPLPIEPQRIEGVDGLRIFDTGSVPAIGIGSTSDPRYDSAHNSWLIAQVTYDVLTTGAGSETRLYLEIGPVGLNHAGEATGDASVIFGHATDVVLNGHDNRGIHPGSFDARIFPRPLPGDADLDGDVDPTDYTIWRTNFGSTTLLAADHNHNGVVDAADYSIWRDNLGLAVGAASAAATPEPPGVLLLLWAVPLALSEFFRGLPGHPARRG